MSENTGKAPQPMVRVYRPDSRLNDGSLRALRFLVAELWRNRQHIGLIFRRDFKAAYRGSRLGVAWNFILPLLPVSVYVFLSVIGVFPGVDGIPRSVYVCVGMTAWLVFADLVERPIRIVKTHNTEAMKTSLPMSVAVASSFASMGFDTLVRLALVLAVVLALKTPLAITAPLALFVLLLGAAFSLALGRLFAVANIVLPDIQNIVTIAMRYGVFVSAVIFPLARIEPLAFLEIINPFAVLINAVRDVLFMGTLSAPVPLAVVTLATLLVGLFSTRIFYLMEYRIRGMV